MIDLGDDGKADVPSQIIELKMVVSGLPAKSGSRGATRQNSISRATVFSPRMAENREKMFSHTR